jgi:hypothetical protein
LRRLLFSGKDQGPDAIQAELLNLVEIDADERIVARVGFDPEDIDAAFAELDSRYLAGEAAAHSQTWSVITHAYDALNRHELPATTPNSVNIDHRRGIAAVPGDLFAAVRASWDVTPDIRYRVESVHRMSNLAAVVTHTSKGTAQEGFDAEWRVINVLAIDGDLLSGAEVFDETDLDAAIARFDELTPSAPRLENVATQTWTLLADTFNRRDVDKFLALSTADGRFEDRRKGLRVVLEGPGRRKAVHAVFEEAPSSWRMEVEPVALRGSRLSLTRECYRDTDDADRPIAVELLNVTEVSAGNLVRDIVAFDPDDIEAAFEELDARYLAGEAAAHARTWSVIAKGYAALNRRELPATTSDWVNIDHRHGTGFEPGGYFAFVRAAWEVAPDMRRTIEAVHRLNTLGAVFTHTAYGTSQEGFDAEWRTSVLLTVDGDLINRLELFDDADIDVALARLDELSALAPVLGNAATRVHARMMDAFNRRDLDSFLAIVTADGRYEDRRKGLRDEGPIKPDFARALFVEAAPNWQEETEAVAIRGRRLVLYRLMFRDHSDVDRPIAVEALVLTEVTDDELASYVAIFDPDDIDGAMAELTARWIASGEVAHPEIIEAHRRLLDLANRHDWDTFAIRSADATYVGHRQLAVGDTIADYISSIRMLASLVPDLWLAPVEILSHSALGVVTYVVMKGTSNEGAQIELPLVGLILFDGDRVSRVETFDPNQRDLALARFEELNRPA